MYGTIVILEPSTTRVPGYVNVWIGNDREEDLLHPFDIGQIKKSLLSHVEYAEQLNNNWDFKIKFTKENKSEAVLKAKSLVVVLETVGVSFSNTEKKILSS